MATCCPLDGMLHLDTRMNLAQVIAIEEHVSSGVCIHPSLKDLFLHGPFEGSTPLLVAKAGNGTVQPVGFPIRTDPQPNFFTFRPLPITNGSTVSRPVPVFKQTDLIPKHFSSILEPMW